MSTWESEMTPEEWQSILRQKENGMDYIITIYPTMYRRYLIEDVDSEPDALDKYYSNNYDYTSMLIDEEETGDDGEVEVELLTPELRRVYGLGEESDVS